MFFKGTSVSQWNTAPEAAGMKRRQLPVSPSLYCWSESEKNNRQDISAFACCFLHTDYRALGQQAGCRGKPCQLTSSTARLLQWGWDSQEPRTPRSVCSAASALPKIFQLRKAATSNISSGNETHCWTKTPFLLPISCIIIFKLLNGFIFFPIYYSSLTPLCRVLGCCTVTLHNHRQPPASGRLTVTQMCHMKGEVGLMTVGNAFAYFLKKKKHLPSFFLIVELRVIPA